MPRNHNLARDWTTLASLRAQVQRLWDRGELLSSLVTGQPLFPKCISLNAPTSAEMAECFADARTWIQQIQTAPHCRVVLRELRHRILGLNRVPYAIWIDHIEDAFALVGKQREAARFTGLVELTRRRQPELLSWLAERPLQALGVSEEWDRLLAVVSWVREHPRPGVYLRQVDIPGIHTKFLEAHRSVLSELLDLVLPVDAIDNTASGVTDFARRYGFVERPIRVRLRPLDPKCLPFAGGPQPDITLDADSFARLDPKVLRVFMTENEINFLSFPSATDSLVIFGKGYGFAALARAEWLSRCRILYWGDIDTHGFAILDQLRSELGEVQSFLMDRATLMAFESYWGVEEKQTLRDLSHLNQEEQELYDDLRDNRIRRNLRLEQERVGFSWVVSKLSVLD